MDYTQTRATVDFVEARVIKAEVGQGHHVRNQFKGLTLHAHGVNPDTGEKFPGKLKNSNSTIFDIRIQDPQRGEDLEAIRTHYKFAQQDQRHGQITALELALDTSYKRNDNDARELAAIAADLWLRLAPIPGEQWHLYRAGQDKRKGDRIKRLDTKQSIQTDQLIDLLADGWMLASCEKDTYQQIRAALYVKTSNGRDSKGKRIELDRKDWSARLEFLYQGAGIEWPTIDQLKVANFADLSKNFKFVDPATGCADRTLNERARNALRKLTDRWIR